MHHPWRLFRSLTEWTLQWSHLPAGTLGVTDHDARTITLTRGMTQAQRRCTIAHEAEHAAAGPVLEVHREREEHRVEAAVARRLLPDPHVVADALVWARGDLEAAAEELWVDKSTLRARLDARYLPPADRAIIVARVNALEGGA